MCFFCIRDKIRERKKEIASYVHEDRLLDRTLDELCMSEEMNE